MRGISLFSLVLLGVISHYACQKQQADLPNPLVTVKQGVLKGLIEDTLFGRTIYSFKGVRYVQPPVGELRFQPPIPIESWDGIYDATQDCASCPQPYLRPVSEDCLCLNVHTPKLPKHGRNPKYPVILYVHPGSLTSLTGVSEQLDPLYLLDKDVVLVTFNYRLASLGFLSTGTKLAPGNNGMKDQIAAMRWVQQNIAAFGGDPNSVSLAGYSAGGVSVSIHLVSPMARGLFHKAFIMSGSALGNLIPKTEQLDLAKRQAQLVGCPDDTPENILECLNDVPAEELGDSLDGFRLFGDDPQFIWQPIIESDFGQERFLTENPLISIQCGRIADVPVMTGITSDELIFLAQPVVMNSTGLEVLNRYFTKIAPYAFYYDPNATNVEEIGKELKEFYFGSRPIDSKSLDTLGEIYSDGLSGFGVHRGADLLATYGKNKVYRYRFSYKGRLSTFIPVEETDKYVVHFDDLLYVFWNSLAFPPFNKTDPETKIVKKMTTFWYNFAREGNPTPTASAELDGVIWEPYTVQNKKYMDINETLVIRRNLYSLRYSKWDRLFPLPPANCGNSTKNKDHH